MKLRNILSAAIVAVITGTSLLAADVMVMDAYARVASKVAKSGAAFLRHPSCASCCFAFQLCRS